jgi:membrane-associated protease RseP (regulator of RpoE activity)
MKMEGESPGLALQGPNHVREEPRMTINLFKKQPLFKILSLLALLILLLPSTPSAGGRNPAPPAPPTPAVVPPQPPPAPEAPVPPHGWLGVLLSDEEGEGVVVTGVKEESPAEKAGLKEGDRILELDGTKIERSRDIRRAMRDLEPGDTVQFRIRRKTLEKTLTATVGKPPERSFLGMGPLWHEDLAPGMALRMMGMARNYLGVRVQSMTEDLRAYFKAPRGRGLLVSRVEEDTPAAKAGLRAGDVIIAVGGKGISERSDIAQALSDHEPGDRVAVKIVRDGSEKTVEVEIAERPGPRRHGAIFLPEGEEIDLDREIDLDKEIDLDRIEVIPEEAEEAVHESVDESPERVREEIHRVMSEIPEKQAQTAAVLRKSRLSDRQMEEIHRQVKEAMEQAREAIRHAAVALKNAPI